MSADTISKDGVVAIAGDIEKFTQIAAEVKQCATDLGGTFSREVDGNEKNLLCTAEDFKRDISAVQADPGNENAEIVTCDRLEDSAKEETCVDTQPYQLDKHVGDEKRKLQNTAGHSGHMNNCIDERHWHVYQDSTHFAYQIKLTRHEKGSGLIGDMHLLTIWESNLRPHEYQCTTLFTKGAKDKAIPHYLRDEPVDLNTAFLVFKSYFKKKTAIAWDDRVDKMGSAGPAYFKYRPPTGGKPIGLIRGQRTAIAHRENRKRGSQPLEGVNAVNDSKRHRASRPGDIIIPEVKDRPTKRSGHRYAPAPIKPHTNARDSGAKHRRSRRDKRTRSKQTGGEEEDDEVYQPKSSEHITNPPAPCKPRIRRKSHLPPDVIISTASNKETQLTHSNALHLARETAANILSETRRGVVLVRDNEAYLIDMVRRERAAFCEQAMRAREQEAREDMLDVEGTESDY
ncbi:hypothetical protein GGS21DRAFT_200622 [Xylaria nigripes]|nr:hypothetical protein GGS21DRAFT_200622 [Xylaria nigripes]